MLGESRFDGCFRGLLEPSLNGSDELIGSDHHAIRPGGRNRRRHLQNGSRGWSRRGCRGASRGRFRRGHTSCRRFGGARRKRNFESPGKELTRPGGRRCIGGCAGSAEQAKPVFRRSGNSPDVGGGFQFDADVKKFAGAAGQMHGPDLRAHQARVFAESRFANLQSDPGAYVAVVAGGIAAAVEIQGDRSSALEKFLAEAVMAGNHEGNGPLDAGAAARFDAGGAARGIDQGCIAQS